MKRRQLLFFTTLADIELIFKEIEAEISLKYYKNGLFDDDNVIEYDSMRKVPNIGLVLSGDWNRIDDYLVMKKETLLNIRDVPQRAGGRKFAVDQLINHQSITIKLGGIYKDVENVIVAGKVATVSDEGDSIELFKLFSSRIRKEFKKIGAFYVGKNAEEKLNRGWRLVTNEKLPKEYDLVAN